jgi:membrane protease YdiL (CAAX protease family)
MKKFIIERPIWFAIAITLFEFVMGLLIFVSGSVLGLPEATLEIVVLLTMTALPLVLIGWLGWWQDAGFVNSTQNASTLVVPLALMLLVLAWFGTVTSSGDAVIRLYLIFFLTGLGEEAMSRGLLLRALLPRGKWYAVLIPSVLFGVSHITQSLFLGMPFSDNMLQIVNAVMFGILYAGVRLRINNIWPLIIIHMLYDTFYGLTGMFGVPNATGFSGIPAAYFAITWMLALIPGIYFVMRPAAATIDGKAVGSQLPAG